MVEELVHGLEILSATPGGKIVLIIIFLGGLTVALLVAGLIYLALRTNASTNRQTDALIQQMKVFAELNKTQGELLHQTRDDQVKQIAAVDKVGDAMQAANMLQEQTRDAIRAMTAQNAETRRLLDQQHGDLLGAVRVIDDHASQTLEAIQVAHADVGKIEEAGKERDQNIRDISVVVDSVKTAVDTLTGAMDTLAKRAVTKGDIDVLTGEVRDLGGFLRVLDQRLTEYQAQLSVTDAMPDGA